MLDLALHYPQGPIKLKEIAKRQRISVQYLEHLFIHLKKAGLVVSIRGAIGGFTLAKPPSQIRLGEIIRGSEGCIDFAECLADPQACLRSDLCVTRDILEEMKRAIDEILESTTLQDLVDRHKEKEPLRDKEAELGGCPVPAKRR